MKVPTFYDFAELLVVSDVRDLGTDYISRCPATLWVCCGLCCNSDIPHDGSAHPTIPRKMSNPYHFLDNRLRNGL